jgi:hypothetical protein
MSNSKLVIILFVLVLIKRLPGSSTAIVFILPFSLVGAILSHAASFEDAVDDHVFLMFGLSHVSLLAQYAAWLI